MQISLRSQMIAGTAAIVGATAIAVTPVMGAQAGVPTMFKSDAEVSLSAFANPITAVLNTVGVAVGYVFNGVYSLATPSLNWPASGIGLLTNAGLKFDPPIGAGYQAPGILPQLLLDPLPVLTQYLSNASGYLYQTAIAVGSALGDIGNIIWSIPTTAIQVVVDLLTLNFAGAISAITGAVTGAIASISSAGTTLLDAGLFVLNNVIAKATALVGTVVGVAPQLVQAVIGQATTLVGSVVNVATGIVTAIATLNPEAIWNAAVSGLLSPAGLPGTLLNLTIGAGVQVTPDVLPATPGTLVPSIRTVGQVAQLSIAEALAAVPTATAAEAPSAAAARSDVAPAAVEAAPAAEGAVADGGSAAGARSEAAAVAPSAVAESAPAAGAGDGAAEAADDTPAPAKAGASRGGRGK